MKSVAFFASLFLATAALAGTPLNERLKSIWPEYTVETIEPTPIPNVLSVKFKEVEDAAYITRDGNFLVEGQVLDLRNKKPRNLQEVMLAKKRANLLATATLPSTSLVIRYPAGQAVKHRLFVLVDTDCGFCQKLHSDLPALQAAGIEVNMLPYPREGVSSHSAQVMSRIWCQKEAPALLTQLMTQGDSLLDPAIACPASELIAQGFALGGALKVVGTPAIFNEKGEMLGGYLSPKELIARLND